ncbi:MAG: hypothetical protein KDK48_03180 [Chlamydiia bacterium]|nr:hypothetical protein [Chlamydiia bacterium]
MKRPKKETLVHVEPLEVSSKAVLFDQITDWLRSNGTNLLYGGAILVAGLILITQWTARSEKGQIADYMQAPAAYERFASGEAPFDEVRKTLLSSPSLEQKYSPLIAQTLLLKGQGQEAAPFSNQALNTLTREQIPAYESFTKNTLLIAEGKLTEALYGSKQLQQSLNPYESSLSVANSLRIIGLYHALGDSAAEKEEIARLLEANKGVDAPKALRALLAETRIGSTNLESYLNARLAS